MGKLRWRVIFTQWTPKKIADCIAQPFSNHELNSIDWKEVNTQYPYFAAAQFMQVASLEKANPKDIEHLAMYKNNPLSFASFIKQVGTPKIVKQETQAPIPEPITVTHEIEEVAEVSQP
jgi:hypothetical protein